MGASNLAVIFGPTLLAPPPIKPPSPSNMTTGNPTGTNPSVPGENALMDMSAQCRAVETILEHYCES